jgi:cytochrome c oxidase subunit III
MNKNKIMMTFFIGSEAFFFLALIIAYVYYGYYGGDISHRAEYLDIKRTSIFTFFLLSSSLTIALAGWQLKRENKKPLIILLLTTIVFGIIFLIGQGTEYARLVNLDVTVSKNVFGSAFFTLTGFHGLHVILGLIVLTLMTIMVATDKFKSIMETTFESASMYWHFVDAVWIAVFSVVYIGAVL